MSEKHANTWYGVGEVTKSNRMAEGYEMKHLGSGTALLKINMCVHDEWKDQSGEVKNRRTFVPLVAWGQKAEEFAEMISGGDIIKVKAEYKQGSFEGDDGQKVYTHDFNVYSLEVLESNGGESAPPDFPQEPREQTSASTPASEPVTPPADPTVADESVDDIPF